MASPQEIVARGYDAVAEEYAGLERDVEWPRLRWLNKVLAHMPEGSTVVDLGCGSGVPATREIAARHHAIGIDVSARQVALARQNVPDAEFRHGDIGTISFPDGSIDAVVAFYVLDHLPRENHADLFKRVHEWLRPGGWMLVTVEPEAADNEVGRWLGVDMFFSCYDADTTRALIREAGFEIVEDPIEPQSEGGREVSYLWVLARKLTD